jgi:protein tyrosine/serine phosphatase
MKRGSGNIRIVVVGVALLAFAATALWWAQAAGLPKRFAEVEPGALYRSGSVDPLQLAQLQSRYKVHTVLSLLNPDAPESREEKAVCERLGIRWLNVGLKGNGESTPEQRDRIRELLDDDSLQPMLVHCAAGVNRTGLAVGMYRLRHDGWSLEQVMKEMRAFDFEDEPHHENLRQALRTEADLVATQRTSAARTSVPAIP